MLLNRDSPTHEFINEGLCKLSVIMSPQTAIAGPKCSRAKGPCLLSQTFFPACQQIVKGQLRS